VSDGWMSLESAPEDTAVLIATDGGWVGEATYLWAEAFEGDYLIQNWTWAGGNTVRHEVYAWQELPVFPNPRVWKDEHPRIATK
jgi:hypothetical protein